MELTEQERKLAEASAWKCRRFLFRRGLLLACLGVVLAMAGVVLLPGTLCPKWCAELLISAGLVLFVVGSARYLMAIIGKLYVKVKDLEQQLEHNSGDSIRETR